MIDGDIHRSFGAPQGFTSVVSEDRVVSPIARLGRPCHYPKLTANKFAQ
jgi:hypothetical protein